MKRLQKLQCLLVCILLAMGVCACKAEPQQQTDADQQPTETTGPSALWTAEQYYAYLHGIRGMVALIDSAPQDEADRLAAFAYLMLDSPDLEQGEDPAILNAVTQQYFGMDLPSMNTSYTRLDEKTGRVFPTGWSFDSSVYFVLREQSRDGNEISATFDVYNVSDSVMMDFNPPRTAQQIKTDLLIGNTAAYGQSTAVTLVFTVETEEAGTQHLKFNVLPE